MISITSPASGSGKTSLTLALGLSFAETGARTLVIDFDFVGGGLTSRSQASARRKLGNILRRAGVLTPEQLDVALQAARTSRRKLGEILLESGQIDPAELEDALSRQATEHLGLVDALGGEKFADCIVGSGLPNLDILPLGRAGARHAAQVSPLTLRRVLSQAKAMYDVVLLDTGPVPGSLEASVAASECEAVVMVIAQGESRPLAERSLRHLIDMGANLGGVVFNRASEQHFKIYASQRSIMVSRRDGVADEETPRSVSRGDRLGPVAHAVAAWAAPDDPYGDQPDQSSSVDVNTRAAGERRRPGPQESSGRDHA